jgi:hypothetical protein
MFAHFLYHQRDSFADGVLFDGVVSAQPEKVVEFFLEREAAEAMIGEVRKDEPALAEELRVEAIELR